MEDMDDAQIEELMSQIPEGDPEFIDADSQANEPGTARESVAFYDEEEPIEIKRSLRELGFEEFRPGQETVVQRILRGIDDFSKALPNRFVRLRLGI